jgi:hypothetical protein
MKAIPNFSLIIACGLLNIDVSEQYIQHPYFVKLEKWANNKHLTTESLSSPKQFNNTKIAFLKKDGQKK